MARPFPAVPAGEVHVVGVNGTLRSEGEQSPGSNQGWARGEAGTVPTSKPFGKPPAGNRTGEGRVR